MGKKLTAKQDARIAAAVQASAPVPRSITRPSRSVYDVHFTIEVETFGSETGHDGQDAELLVEEAVTAVFDEELAAHREGEGATRMGLRFDDAHGFDVRFVERLESETDDVLSPPEKKS